MQHGAGAWDAPSITAAAERYGVLVLNAVRGRSVGLFPAADAGVFY